MTTETTYREVFRFTHDAWQIHLQNETIITTDDYHADHSELCELVEIDLESDNHEDWSCKITECDDQHSALQAGDAVVCEGYGSDVIIWRGNKGPSIRKGKKATWAKASREAYKAKLPDAGPTQRLGAALHQACSRHCWTSGVDLG